VGPLSGAGWVRWGPAVTREIAFPNSAGGKVLKGDTERDTFEFDYGGVKIPRTGKLLGAQCILKSVCVEASRKIITPA